MHFVEFSSHSESWAPKNLAYFFLHHWKNFWVDVLTRSCQLWVHSNLVHGAFNYIFIFFFTQRPSCPPELCLHRSLGLGVCPSLPPPPPPPPPPTPPPPPPPSPLPALDVDDCRRRLKQENIPDNGRCSQKRDPDCGKNYLCFGKILSSRSEAILEGLLAADSVRTGSDSVSESTWACTGTVI